MRPAWPVREALEARRSRHGSRPSKRHSCGLYAFAEREQALAYAQPRSGRAQLLVQRLERALGIVSGWGRVVRHTRGWRSQFAYPYDLYLTRGDRGLARELADRDAVETSPFPPAPAA